MKKLKKSQIFLITTCGLAALFFTFILMVGLSTDDFGFGEKTARPRNNAGTHDIDPEESGVDSLEISWLDGAVTVDISPDNMIHITERSEDKLDEGNQMDVSVKSGTLSVRWDNQWFRKWINIGWFGRNTKELEVLLPRALAEDLAELEAGNTSDSIHITGCGAGKMNISTVSGELLLKNCTVEKELRAESVSGDVVLEGPASAKEMHISTVSGNVKVESGDFKELRIETVSGGCGYAGAAEELHFNTVSGDMSAMLRNSPEKAKLESVSGSLTLGLPEGAGFTADYDSVSGEFRSDFPVEKNGGKARYGTGGADIKMSTTSGGMAIEKTK